MHNFGNAKNWYTSAQNNGFSVGSTPKAKSIAVWTDSSYGHVGYVVSVNGSKITVNEGGMLDTNGNAYNGTGILNGSVCNSAVGSTKSSYSSKILVGYIYLTENNSVGNAVTLKAAEDKNTISSNNAVIWGRVDKPSDYAVTKIGIKVRKKGSTYDKGWEKYEAPSKSYVGNTYMYPYYDLKSELSANLIHATKYYYRFYAIVNGKEYWSDEYNFTTTGSHSYDNACDTTCNVCGNTRKVESHKYTNDCDTTCNVCGAAREITHKYTNACDTTCNVCGATRKVGSHKYTSDCDTTCSICGAVRKIAHKYTNSCDTDCNICGAKRVITHSFKTVTAKATLTKNGSIVKKCSVCGTTASTTIIYSPKTFKLSTTSYTYSGSAKKPSVTVKDASGETLKNGTDYTVSYKNNKNVGTATATVTFKGNYSGSKKLNFTIKPKTTSLSKLTAGSKQLKVTWKKNSSVSGYQIQYSTSKKFLGAKTVTVKSYKTTSSTLKSLKAKKTYYVRIRTYKTVNGKKVYSDWSKALSKKTK